MSLAVPDPGLLRSSLRPLASKVDPGQAVAFHCGGWHGPARVNAGARPFDVRWCGSSLAVREALSKLGPPEDADAVTVILTRCGAEELGLDTLSRLHRRRLFTLDMWQALRQAFGAEQLDSRLGQHPWLVDELLASLPPGGYQPVPAGTLDLDHAWSVFFETRLDLTGAVDLPTLLDWCRQPGGPERLRSLATESAGAVLERVEDRSGLAAAHVLRLACRGDEADAVPLGLVCRLIFDDTVDRAAAARLEEFLGGVTLTVEEGRRWAEAAESWLGSSEGAAAREARRRAKSFIERFKISDRAHASIWLGSGLDQRLERFAARLGNALDAKDDSAAQELDDLAAQIGAHRMSREHGRTARMAARLVRWLASAATDAEAASFQDAARQYAEQLALVDLARDELHRTELGRSMAPVVRRLLERVTAARERFNRRFGELAHGYFAAEPELVELVPVEEALDRVVTPLARQSPVLLLVLDGLSFAVFHQLVDDLLERGWEPRLETGRDAPYIGVAALPGITKVSRASLFTGRLRQDGSQAAERDGLARQPGLLAAGDRRLPPVLFHKADLRDDGHGLAETVRGELERRQRRVVAVVLNLVDDLLTRGDQLRPDWSLARFRFLEEILETAGEAGRVVVLTADHGHLPEHGTERERAEGSSDRYRPANGSPAGEGEMLVEGRRVQAPGHRLVAPWSEALRYGYSKAGYHGGITPQELLVPLAVYARSDSPLEGWHHQVGALPAWWEPGATTQNMKTGELQPTKAPSIPRKQPAPDQAQLFPRARPEEGEVAASEVEADRWTPLFESEMWSLQAAALGTTVSESRVRRVLDLLDDHGGRLSLAAACRALNIGLPRLRSMVAQIQRLLNVDAYPILDLDEPAGELRLQRELLIEQFELAETA